MSTDVAIAHDYLTQRGGAERVVLELLAAFPGAPLHTTLYDREATYPGFSSHDVRPAAINRVALLRRHHRLALPVLAGAVSRLDIDADVVVCSSSGWAHGVTTSGRKIVYCHNPARWLYQQDRYLAGLGMAARRALRLLTPSLRRWDRAAALTAHRYLANSTVVQHRIRKAYGRDAEVVYPPVSLDVDGAGAEVAGVEPGFLLCVSRLLPYKHVDVVTAAMEELPDQRLVVVGEGPLGRRLRNTAPSNVHFVGTVPAAELRWLYRNAAAAVTAAHEDFGLVPIEAAAFGVPTVALGSGGHLDSVRDGETGVLFSHPAPEVVAEAVRRAMSRQWDRATLLRRAADFSAEAFRERMRVIVAEELELAQLQGTSPRSRYR